MVQGSFVGQGASTPFCDLCFHELILLYDVLDSPCSYGRAVWEQGLHRKQGADDCEWCVFFHIKVTEVHQSLVASRKIQQVATAMRLSEIVQLAATRLYTLAVEHKFTKGRKSMNVVAVCLYVACRQKETRNYMLIDFSDLLQVRFPYSIDSVGWG